MATSVNGWPLVPSGSPQLTTLPGIPTGPVALAGPVATILGYVAAQFHARVEAITSTSSHRPDAKIGTTGLFSNHASATAVDLNGGRHPQFRRGTFTVAQVSQIRLILVAARVIDWGGDWDDASVDEMHFEIRPGTTAQQVAAAAAAITAPTPPTNPTTPSEEDEMPFRIHVTSSPNTPSEVGKVYLAQFGPTGHCLFQHINPEENGVHELVKTPIYNVSHYQKDLIRKNIITREAAWKVV